MEPKTVFFVDDDKFLLDMYALKFSKANFEVKTADSTETALKLLRDGYNPDLMLIDIIMPSMTGLEMISKVRSERLAPGSVVIMLTNQSASEDISKAKALNVDGYIVKATAIPSEVLAEARKIYASKKTK